MMMATVSVVIPSYNSAAFLKTAISSALGQSLRPVEVIVVDDSSTDGSLQVARDAGVRTLTTGKNGGPAAARNMGIAAAQGEFIAFLDADDYWETDHCELTVGLLQAQPTAAVAFAGVKEFGLESRNAESWLPEGVACQVLARLLGDKIVYQSSAVVRRSVLREVGGYREEMRFAEDYDLWLRIARQYDFVATQARTVNYRRHDRQASLNSPHLFRSAWEARSRIWLASTATETPSRLRELESALQRGWDSDLNDAWHERNPAAFRTVLAVHELVPGGGPIFRRWRRRAFFLSQPRRLRLLMWSRIPAVLQRSIRRSFGVQSPAAEHGGVKHAGGRPAE